MKGNYRKMFGIAGIFAILCLTPAFAAATETPVGPGWTGAETKTQESGGSGTGETGAEAGAAETGDSAAESGVGTGETGAEAGTAETGDSGAALPSWMASETKDVIVVTADQKDSSRATVAYYKLEEEWKEVFSVRGIIGKAGLAGPDEKREGDKKTPSGGYRFTMAFGIKEDPGSVMEYHKIRRGDVWVDDSASVHYNRMVNGSDTEKDWNSAENLASMSPWYNYCLALSYNEGQVPEKGSAIFLHCLREEDWGTSGCIGIPEKNMEILLKNLDINSRIFIETQK